ncbi:hypothetical protein GGF32_009023 [Allomyces javanicus]|nr:hypothetical protein GGF32_009023 [Allomyces javanicus]
MLPTNEAVAELRALEARIDTEVLALAVASPAAAAANAAGGPHLTNVQRDAFVATVTAVLAIVQGKRYRATHATLEDYFRAYRLSRAQVYRLIDCALLYTDFLDGIDQDDAELPVSLLHPFPLKQRVCKTLRSLAPSPPLRRRLWATTLHVHVRPPLADVSALAIAAQLRAMVSSANATTAGSDDDDSNSDRDDPPAPADDDHVDGPLLHVDDLTSKHVKDAWEALLRHESIRQLVHEASIAATTQQGAAGLATANAAAAAAMRAPPVVHHTPVTATFAPAPLGTPPTPAALGLLPTPTTANAMAMSFPALSPLLSPHEGQTPNHTMPLRSPTAFRRAQQLPAPAAAGSSLALRRRTVSATRALTLDPNALSSPPPPPPQHQQQAMTPHGHPSIPVESPTAFPSFPVHAATAGALMSPPPFAHPPAMPAVEPAGLASAAEGTYHLRSVSMDPYSRTASVMPAAVDGTGAAYQMAQPWPPMPAYATQAAPGGPGPPGSAAAAGTFAHAVAAMAAAQAHAAAASGGHPGFPIDATPTGAAPGTAGGPAPGWITLDPREAPDNDLLNSAISILQELALRGHKLQPFIKGQWLSNVDRWRFWHHSQAQSTPAPVDVTRAASVVPVKAEDMAADRSTTSGLAFPPARNVAGSFDQQQQQQQFPPPQPPHHLQQQQQVMAWSMDPSATTTVPVTSAAIDAISASMPLPHPHPTAVTAAFLAGASFPMSTAAATTAAFSHAIVAPAGLAPMPVVVSNPTATLGTDAPAAPVLLLEPNVGVLSPSPLSSPRVGNTNKTTSPTDAGNSGSGGSAGSATNPSQPPSSARRSMTRQVARRARAAASPMAVPTPTPTSAPPRTWAAGTVVPSSMVASSPPPPPPPPPAALAGLVFRPGPPLPPHQPLGSWNSAPPSWVPQPRAVAYDSGVSTPSGIWSSSRASSVAAVVAGAHAGGATAATAGEGGHAAAAAP